MGNKDLNASKAEMKNLWLNMENRLSIFYKKLLSSDMNAPLYDLVIQK